MHAMNHSLDGNFGQCLLTVAIYHRQKWIWTFQNRALMRSFVICICCKILG